MFVIKRIKFWGEEKPKEKVLAWRFEGNSLFLVDKHTGDTVTFIFELTQNKYRLNYSAEKTIKRLGYPTDNIDFTPNGHVVYFNKIEQCGKAEKDVFLYTEAKGDVIVVDARGRFICKLKDANENVLSEEGYRTNWALWDNVSGDFIELILEQKTSIAFF